MLRPRNIVEMFRFPLYNRTSTRLAGQPFAIGPESGNRPSLSHLYPMLKKYLIYLARWQLSTPILALCVVAFAALGPTWATVLANLIGGIVFFWLDRWIFNNTAILRGELWEVCTGATCADCGRVVDRGYRLVKAKGYDRTNDRRPQFRCHDCSRRKYQQMAGSK